ncbi:FtsX-like permease family protein [Planosporangium sp. 12N6]|uniref:FtsX-like permease family protein n=1 Tax=Planosporangium spinosum TaxID=3402278 RepID=UPI003CFBBC1B
MIRFGLRLAVASGREAVTRLVVIAAAVALGVGLLLATLAGMNAVNAVTARFAWQATGAGSTAGQSAGAPATDPVWWLVREDYFAGHKIVRLDVAATGPDSPVPPGIPHLPGPGQFYASPALSELLGSTPAGQLADRFPGQRIGTVGPAALPSPTSLVIVVGRTPDQLSHLDGAVQATSIRTTPAGRAVAALDLVLSVVAGGLLFPVLIFIGTATRLAAARREQRFAAMRLIGATPRQISVISAVESTAAAVAGTAVGFGLFFLFRHRLAAIPFTGEPFFPADLSLNVLDVLLVALGIPVGAAVAARIALRRVRISPLGVTRRVTPRAPRAYRLVPLLLGIGELAFFIGRRPSTSDGQVAAFLPGVLLIMAGLVIAGPWLTMVGARAMARRSSRPAALIAARRLADNPQAGFRAISGLVLALFVTSVAAGVITTIVAERGAPRDGKASGTLYRLWPGAPDPGVTTSVPDAIMAGLRATPGVRSATVVRWNPAALDRGSRTLPGLVSCADLARTPAFGRCADGAAVAQVWPDLSERVEPPRPSTVWPTASMSAEDLQRLPVASVVVGTDGSTTAIERARTVLEVAYPDLRQPPFADGDFESDFTNTLTGWQRLADVVILASLAIAGCSLAVSVVGGLTERKRPFSLLRLTGVPVRLLRRVVALESAVPLLVAAVVAVGTGFLAAHLFLRAQMDYSLRFPGSGYHLIVLAGIAASLGIIASTLPFLERITGPETARNE